MRARRPKWAGGPEVRSGVSGSPGRAAREEVRGGACRCPPPTIAACPPPETAWGEAGRIQGRVQTSATAPGSSVCRGFAVWVSVPLSSRRGCSRCGWGSDRRRIPSVSGAPVLAGLASRQQAPVERPVSTGCAPRASRHAAYVPEGRDWGAGLGERRRGTERASRGEAGGAKRGREPGLALAGGGGVGWRAIPYPRGRGR